MDAKEFITAYYKSDAYGNPEVMERFVHKDVVLEWRNSKGLSKLSKEDMLDFIKELKRSYSSYRIEINNIVADGNKASVQYTHYADAIENPDEEIVLGYFMAIWEIKDKKLYRGYLISQAG